MFGIGLANAIAFGVACWSFTVSLTFFFSLRVFEQERVALADVCSDADWDEDCDASKHPASYFFLFDDGD